MNLYLMRQDENNNYDTYDSVVVAAKSPKDARTIHPGDYVTHVANNQWMGTYTCGEKKEYDYTSGTWVNYDQINLITVEFLGTTKRSRGVVLGSFNAG